MPITLRRPGIAGPALSLLLSFVLLPATRLAAQKDQPATETRTEKFLRGSISPSKAQASSPTPSPAWSSATRAR